MPMDAAFQTSGSPDAATVRVRPISISGTASGHDTRHVHTAGISVSTAPLDGDLPSSESQGMLSPTLGHEDGLIDGNAKPSCMR